MAVKIKHVCKPCSYVIEEHNGGLLDRYIVLDNDEMKQLSKLLKEEEFQ